MAGRNSPGQEEADGDHAGEVQDDADVLDARLPVLPVALDFLRVGEDAVDVEVLDAGGAEAEDGAAGDEPEGKL